MKRIYLRFLEETPSGIDFNYDEIKEKLEGMIGIKWETEPQSHIKGGFFFTGYFSNDTDMEDFLVRMRNDGYIAVY